MPIQVQQLENPALRDQLELDRQTSGVVVRRVHRRCLVPAPRGGCHHLRRRQALDNAGMVHMDGGRLISFRYLVDRQSRGGKMAVRVVREGMSKDLEVPVHHDENRIFLYSSEASLPFFIFGPLVFSEASEPFVSYLLTPTGPQEADSPRQMIFSMNPLYTRYGDRPAFPGSESLSWPAPCSVTRSARDTRILTPKP